MSFPAEQHCSTPNNFISSSTCGVHANSTQLLNYPAWLYHAHLERQSSSLLKPLLQSPAHYKAQFFQRRQPSAAMDFGTLVHMLVLEPHRFHTEYLVVPDKPNVREARELRARHLGKKLLSDIELHIARNLAGKVLERPFKGRPFARYLEEGRTELTIFYDDPATSVPCRVRLDLWHPDFLFDLKTTRHTAAQPLIRNAVDLHYDLQAYMYSFADALHSGMTRPRPFVFMAAANEPPFNVHALTAGATFMDNGRAKYERAIALYRACSDLDYWPADQDDIEMEIEPWQEYRPGLMSSANLEQNEFGLVEVTAGEQP